MALAVNVVASLLNAAHELISTMMKCSTCLFVMTRVSTEARWRMVSLHLDAGWSYNRISDHFGVAKSTVRDQIQRYLETRNVADRPRSGRPRVLDEDDSRLCVSMAESDPFVTLPLIQGRLRTTSINVSRSTISRRLHSTGLSNYRPLKFPRLTESHKEQRVLWARAHRRWSALQQWRQVIFTDESRFCVRWHDGRIRVWRYPRARIQQDAVQWTVRPGSTGSEMVWVGISWNHKSTMVVINQTVNGKFYRDRILEQVAIPFGLASIGPGFLLQDDNAPPHRSRLVREYHESHQEYTHMEWPSLSPDLNPIEHMTMWDELGRAT